MRKAIADTSVFIALYHLNLVRPLQFFYEEVLIPEKVEDEFLNKNPDPIERSKRLFFLTQFYKDHQSWFKKCPFYDSGIVGIYMKEEKIHEGEAEVFAQNQYLDFNYHLLLDDNAARKYAKTHQWAHNGVLYILAKMEIQLSICSYRESCERLQLELNFHLNPAVVELAYQKVQREFK